MFIALLLKLLTTAYLLNIHWDHTPGYTSGDAPAYLHTAKQIATHGTYSLYNSPEGDPLPYAGRLPGYDVVLSPLFLLFQEARTVAIVAIILQLLLACLSLYYLYRLMLKFVPHGWIPTILLWLYAVNVFTGVYDIKNYSESFSVSALIIGLALTLDYRSKRELLFGSLFLLWAYLLRPPVLPICLMAWVYPLINTRRLRLAWTFAPLLLFTLVWSGRNYNQFNRFIPLTSDLHGGYQFKPWQLATFSLVSTWGGDITWWRDNAEIKFFIEDTRTPSLGTCEEAMELLPVYVRNYYPSDSLCRIRALLAEAMMGDPQVEIFVTRGMAKMETGFKSDRPLEYHVLGRLNLLINFLKQNGTNAFYNDPFHELKAFEKMAKGTQFLLYWLVLFLGITGGLYVMLKGDNAQRILAVGMFFIILVFPLLLRRIEFRYIIHFYPIALLLSTVLINVIKTKIQLLKIKNLQNEHKETS